MSKIRYAVLVIVTTFLMGVAFPVGKMGMAYAPPFLLMGIRYVLAGGLLAAIVAKKPRPRGMKQWLQAGTVGLLQSAGVMGLVYYSMNWISSSQSSIIMGTNPLLVIILGSLLTGAVYRARQWLGVTVGFIGVAITFGFQLEVNIGSILCFAGALCFAAATLLIKRWGPTFDMNVLAAYQMLAGGFALLIISLFTEHAGFVVNGRSLTVLLWLIIMCSIVQFSLWFYLLRNGDPAKTSAFLFLVPFFGVLTSWLLLGESMEWYVAAGGVLICVGVFLVNWEGKTGSYVQTSRISSPEHVKRSY
ncbi:DMT family transporter [Brevibacillus migulae]|uniref:DMT family transporter n=1 Tax=Brevibacillus migulae TaxID=1644114 RepID=UPI00106E612C|nr:DMT family transporter [Brevibacillus migulae]